MTTFPPPPLRIRDVVIDPPVLPAPMCGISDRAWRLLARDQGCSFTYTQMVSGDALLRNDPKSFDLIDVVGEEGPVGIQLFGHDPDVLGKAAGLLEGLGAAVVDLNMGCPARKVVQSMGGSRLLCFPDLVRDIFRSMRAHVRGALTIKVRAGWNKEDGDCFRIAAIAVEEGIDAIAIHARTREQGYKGRADWSIIAELKRRVPVPVIGNGDVNSADDCERMFRETGCDGVMIGRGIMGNPWLLGECRARLRGEPDPPRPSVDELFAMMTRHAGLMAKRRGEHRGLIEFRKHAVQYVSGMYDATTLKKSLMGVHSVEHLKQIFADFSARLRAEGFDTAKPVACRLNAENAAQATTPGAAATAEPCEEC